MNNERYNQIIDEVYENFIKSYTGKDNEIILPPLDYINDDGNLMSKNQFITSIKYDYWFSETWGLKIEEHILTFEERHMLWDDEGKEANVSPFMEKQLSSMLDKENIPTKLITLTYNNETIEVFH
jgi:hypothetical protein